MVAEDRVENLGEEGYLSLGKMLQGPVRDTVWAGGIADHNTPDGFLNLVMIRYVGFAGGGQEVRPQRHVNHLIKCRD